MFRDQREVRRRLQELVQIFRQKGAVSQEKAMTVQELGLPPRFEEAMHRRLGQSGIFVEVNGKYYLNEGRLRQIQEQRARGGNRTGGGAGGGRQSGWTRAFGTILMLPIGIIVALVLFYFFAFNGGYFPGELLIFLLVVMLAVFAARMLFWRSRRRNIREQWGRTNQAAPSPGRMR
jgi:hypothetical protein